MHPEPNSKKSQRSDGGALQQCHPLNNPICQSLIVFSLSFAVSMPFTMILTITRTLMGGSAETSLAEYLLLTACTTLLSIFAGVFQTGITLFYLNTACSRPANCQSVLRLQILIQKIAWDLRSTDPAEYGMYTSV